MKWKQVSKEEFTEKIYKRDVIGSIIPEPYPYTTEFKLRDGQDPIGKVVRSIPPGGAEIFCEYFLRDYRT